MAKRDYYEVLGVARNATADQIKSAYRKSARKYHPDVNKAADAPAKFREATEAYDALSDDKKRKLYDQFGHAGMGAGGAGPGGGRPGGPQSYTWTGGPGEGINFEEMFGGGGGASNFGGMGLEDILDALRGGGARRGGRRSAAPPAPPQDLEYHLTLDFVQAVQGVTTSVRLQLPTGQMETISVKIPPGVQEGSKVRVRGKGVPGMGGAGDLYIIVHVTEHPYFRRENDDIHVDLPVSITEAALGAKVDVPTIDGMTTITVPPGSSTGRQLRLRSKGVAKRSSTDRGDQYVHLKVMVPPSLSPRGQELLKELAQVEKYDPRKDVGWR